MRPFPFVRISSAATESRGVLLPFRQAKSFTLGVYESSYSAKPEAGQRSFLSRELCQQRADARQHLGLLSSLRHPATTERNQRGNTQLPGDLFEPATGEGASGVVAAERCGIRERVWRNKTGSPPGGSGPDKLTLAARGESVNTYAKRLSFVVSHCPYGHSFRFCFIRGGSCLSRLRHIRSWYAYSSAEGKGKFRVAHYHLTVPCWLRLWVR